MQRQRCCVSSGKAGTGTDAFRIYRHHPDLFCHRLPASLLRRGSKRRAKRHAWVQAAASESLGGFGTVFITVALCLFAFTTLIGNFYYAEMGLKYLCGKTPGKALLNLFRIIAALIVLAGAVMNSAWCGALLMYLGLYGPHQPAGYPAAWRYRYPVYEGLCETEKRRT